MSESTLLLVDGHSVVRRVYEAVNGGAPMIEAEKVKQASRSSLQSLRRAFDEHPSTHALVAFDAGGKNWRHALYPEYKANREESTPEFKAMIAPLRERVEGVLGVHTVAVPGVEADDVIGTVVRRWIESGRDPARITILSGDKDLVWLTAHRARVYDHFGAEWRGAEWIEKKFGAGIRAAQILDWLALNGDKVDGVPGLKGCGKVTATRWLNEFGTLDALIERAAEVSGKIGETLRAGIEDVRLSRRLVSLKTRVECGVTWGLLRRQ
ncbi:5'-3' exonuclease H3TH domain-containing protein [Paraburkholderia sp. BR10936]|uniref:5'-3' exonuclease n=1 Tax=Paraburkholderia sp. BR10936 TaxID=3236993 RepID=UPI0034D1696C